MTNGLNQNPRVRRRLGVCIAALALALLLILINLCAGLLPWSLRSFSIGEQSAFSISSPTKVALSGLQEDVTIYLITADGEINVDRDLYAMLKSYEALSEHIHVSVVSDKADPAFLASRGYVLADDAAVAFLVESDRRARMIPLDQLYFYECVSKVEDESYTMTFSPSEYATYGAGFGSVTPYFGAEATLTNAVSFVTREDVPTVAVLENDTVFAVDAAFLIALANKNYEILSIGSVSELDASRHDMLLYNTPLLDISESERASLSAYLAAGGDMFLTTYYGAGTFQNLAAVLDEYGLSADEKSVRLVENHKDYSINYGSMNYLLPKISSAHGATGDFDGIYMISDAHAIFVEEKEGISTTSWLYTTEKGSRERVKSSTSAAEPIEEERDVYTYGVIAERGESRVIWVATPYALGRDFDILSNGYNYDLMENATEWMMEGAGADAIIEILPNEIRAEYLYVEKTWLIVMGIILIGLIPGAVVLIGGLRQYFRRRA